MTRISRITGFSLLLTVLVQPLATLANPYEHTLKNGLKVIVKEDHRAPVVVSQVWYRAGSIDEFNGTTGVAHVLEHMMFKGTPSVPTGEFSKLIAAAGGRDNAFTSRDHTAYFQQLQKSKLELSFKLEADRMQNLQLTDKEFGKEIKVVMEERRWRTDDKPQALVYEDLNATAYQAHPYRRPIIGWMNDLENMTGQDARDWYHRWYAPNNAVLVVVGDVQPQAVFKLAEKYFGTAKARPLPVRKPQLEPEQLGIRRVNVKAPAKLPYIMMGYHAPVLHNPEKDWEPYALEMLAGVLDGNESARLNKSLVRDARIASSVGAGYDSVARGPGMFALDGTPSEGKKIEDLELALREQIEKIKKEGVTEDELQRVKAQVIAGQVYQRDSMFYQAMLIGEYEIAGVSYKSLDTRLAKLKAVTPAQVQEVARMYLVDDSLTVATLDPQPLEGKKPMAPPKGLPHE
ncbi:M16 family metallopeptidase [Sulfurirhabdus autotrophica]|uniref:Zinc protease n=1 Tax=Sulfurirhabdus autotrophica TaxID=1706046 RepID=A0A4R3XY53_9PROT|nr:pitrilysin family protein [Sulfurirhabdus autotrophica]TCV84735.1 zinc protease [Sulfurirhabdus autotrophica]